MRQLFKNAFVAKKTDSLGMTLIKGVTRNYIKGTVAAGVCVGTLYLIGLSMDQRVNSEKDEVDKILTDKEELEEMEVTKNSEEA